MTPIDEPKKTPPPLDLPETAGVVESAPRRGLRSVAMRVIARTLVWSPVFAVLALFAQVSFLGLRPALSEAKRLADADVVLSERHERAVAVNREVTAQMQARADPIYRERQRRARTLQQAPASDE